jgi:AraC-like DNA-binding protein
MISDGGPDVEVLNGDVTRVTTEWRDRHYHADPYSRLYYVSHGVARIFLGAGDLELRAGCFYLFPSGTLLKLVTPVEEFEHYWVHFSASFSFGMNVFDTQRFPLTLDKSRFFMPVPMMKRLVRFARMIHASSESARSVRMEANALLRVLLCPFLDAMKEAKVESAGSFDGVARFSDVMSFIEQNLARHLTVDQLAARVHLHPVYFASLFRREIGVSPKEYLCRRRIEKAQLMLIHSHDSVKEIAAAVGYGDEYYFSRMFRKVTGVPPTVYRQRRRSPRF